MIEARWPNVANAFRLTAEEFYRRLERLPWVTRQLGGTMETERDQMDRARELEERKERRRGK